jgi:hypothetical protein
VFRPSSGIQYLFLSTQLANPGFQIPLGETNNAVIYGVPPVTPFIGTQ